MEHSKISFPDTDRTLMSNLKASDPKALDDDSQHAETNRIESIQELSIEDSNNSIQGEIKITEDLEQDIKINKTLKSQKSIRTFDQEGDNPTEKEASSDREFNK